MDKAELLTSFTDRVDQFERYQGFILKAQSQSDKFAAAVVEKVVADNRSKCLDVVSDLVPLMADMEAVIEQLQAARQETLDSSRESQFRLEELELRHAIGDLSDEDFESEAADFKAVVGNTDEKVAELDDERERFEEVLTRWKDLGASAGMLTEEPERTPAPTARREPEPVPMPEPEPEPMAEPDIVIEAAAAPIETFDVAPDVDDEGDAEVVFEEPAGDDGFEVDDLDLVDEDSDIQLDEGGAGEEKDKPRRAVLLYQEGTAEEQIYPFTGEVMSLGRGRDNDVQVKNDSKVSRYHCKLYRRGPNFYIEDNKSANGTLVNGELITERRLFGGEEVIIGETFFRFRILD